MKTLNRLFFLILIFAIIVSVFFLIYQLSLAKKITIKHSERPLIETMATELPIDPTDPIIGNQGAAITIAAFIDFNDAESRRVYRVISAFIEANPAKIRMIFKDFPEEGFFSGENSLKPHIAAFCAHKKNKFSEYAAELAKLGGKTTDSGTLSEIAGRIGLQNDTWQPCLNSTEAKTRIESSVALAKSVGLKKAPVVFVNNMRVNYLDEIDLNDFLNEIIKEYSL